MYKQEGLAASAVQNVGSADCDGQYRQQATPSTSDMLGLGHACRVRHEQFDQFAQTLNKPCPKVSQRHAPVSARPSTYTSLGVVINTNDWCELVNRTETLSSLL